MGLGSESKETCRAKVRSKASKDVQKRVTELRPQPLNWRIRKDEVDDDAPLSEKKTGVRSAVGWSHAQQVLRTLRAGPASLPRPVTSSRRSVIHSKCTSHPLF